MQPITALPSRDRGFTLLEALIAFVIAALALTVLYQGSLDGLSAVTVSGRAGDATQRAQSRLAAVIRGGALTPGDRRGDDGGGYGWRVLVRPVASSSAINGSAAAALYAVTVWITWRAGGGRMREVRLDSESVGPLAR